MELRFIAGRAGSGKTDLVLDEIKNEIDKDNKRILILIVPEQFTLQAEYDLISKKNLEGIMSVNVLSFKRLAYKVFEEAGGLKRITINELGKVMVLRNLFDKYQDKLNVYKKVSRQDGFLRDFCKLITEFKENDITYERIEQNIDNDIDDEMFKNKLKDIAFMYDKFNQYMDGRYSDEEDSFNLLIEKLDEYQGFENAEIWIDGFTSFTCQKQRIIQSLIKKAKRVNISLTLDTELNKNDSDLFECTRKTYRKLCDAASEIGAEVKLKQVDCKQKKEEFKHLESELYSYPYRQYELSTDSIEVFAANNQYTEMEYTAGKIISFVRDKGYRWKDIAVVTGSIDQYCMNIKRVFNEYNIPFFIDEKRSIMNNPLIKLILSSLRIIQRNFRYDDVFRAIKTGFTELDKDEYEMLENYALKYGIRGNKWFREFDYEKEIFDQINEIREKFISPLILFKQKIRTSKTVKEITVHVFELLGELKIEQKLNNWIDELKHHKRLEYVNENTQIWNIVMEIFDQLVKIMGDNEITLKDYIKILEAGFSEYEVGIIPPTQDQVLVGTLDRSKSHSIKALFVVGVNDGILPSVLEDGGILLDDEKIILKSKGIEVNSDSTCVADEERMSIYSSFTKPSEYLFLSYSLSDMEGKALRKSILINRILKLYPKIIEKSDLEISTDIELCKITSPVPTFKYLIENIRNWIDDNKIDSVWWDVYEWYINNSLWSERIDTMISGLFHCNQQSYIDEIKARELYTVPLISSVSRIEKFARCPFSHFVDYGLRPEKRQEYKIGLPDIGTIFHKSVEYFAINLKKQGIDWKNIDKEKSEEIIESVIDKIVKDYYSNIFESTNRYKYLINKVKRVGKRATWTLIQHAKKGEFCPIAHEINFTNAPSINKIPPVDIKLSNGDNIVLEGRIDRVDVLKKEDKSYVNVIDYKSGSRKFSLSEVFHGLELQLFVYLDAVLESKEALVPGIKKPGGIFYFKIDDPLINLDYVNTEDFEKEIFKRLKLDGIVLKNPDIVKALDKDIEKERNSLVIPVQLKTNGDFSKRSKVATEEDIRCLTTHIKKLIANMGEEILNGNIKIEPCVSSNTDACKYCELRPICQFDTGFKDNKYNNIKKISDEEVLSKVRDENGGENTNEMD